VLTRLVAAVLVVFAALNGVLALVVEQSGLAERPLDVQTRGLYEVRLGELGRAAVAGDSLAFGAHLADKHGASWPALALPGQLEQRLRKAGDRDVEVLNLGINGLLFRELGCVVRDVLARRPALLFVNVSPRPFASDFADDPEASARPFVCPDPSLEGRASAWLRRALPVLRQRDLVQLGWLGDTPRGVLQSALSGLFAGPAAAAPAPVDEEEEEDDAFVAAMMWRFKAAQRLNSIGVRSDHPQAQELAQLLRAVREAPATRVVMFYLHEDEAALAGQLDVPRLHAEQARFAELVARGLAGAARARFVELPSAEFAGEYVDHVHLTARGYARLADRLLAALPEARGAAAH
jgi:lysophospholipase L1-like esterase